MTLTLHLPPEIEAQLHAEASRSGKDPNSVVLDALREKLSQAAENGFSPSSQLSALRSWLANPPQGNPNADFSRDSIYGNRGE